MLITVAVCDGCCLHSWDEMVVTKFWTRYLRHRDCVYAHAENFPSEMAL